MPDNEAKKLKGEENSVDDSSRNDWLLYPTRTRYISRCDWMEREYRTSKSNSNHLYRARNKNRDEVSRRGYRMPLVLPIFLSLSPSSIHVLLLQRRLVTEDNAILLLSERGSVAVQSLSTAQCPFSRFTGMKTYRSSNGRQPSVIEHPIEKNFDVTKNSTGQRSSFLKSWKEWIDGSFYFIYWIRRWDIII